MLLRLEAPNLLSRGTSSGDDRTARAAYGGGAIRFLARGREPND